MLNYKKYNFFFNKNVAETEETSKGGGTFERGDDEQHDLAEASDGDRVHQAGRRRGQGQVGLFERRAPKKYRLERFSRTDSEHASSTVRKIESRT